MRLKRLIKFNIKKRIAMASNAGKLFEFFKILLVLIAESFYFLTFGQSAELMQNLIFNMKIKKFRESNMRF